MNHFERHKSESVIHALKTTYKKQWHSATLQFDNEKLNSKSMSLLSVKNPRLLNKHQPKLLAVILVAMENLKCTERVPTLINTNNRMASVNEDLKDIRHRKHFSVEISKNLKNKQCSNIIASSPYKMSPY